MKKLSQAQQTAMERISNSLRRVKVQINDADGDCGNLVIDGQIAFDIRRSTVAALLRNGHIIVTPISAPATHPRQYREYAVEAAPEVGAAPEVEAAPEVGAAPEVEAAPEVGAAPEVETVLEATSHFGGSARVKITETGYEVLHDDRRCQDGYLHICDDSADRITDACRDQLLRYLYMSKPDHQGKRLPSLGATPQHQYFRGLSLQEREAIGNGGKSCCYTRPTWHGEA